MPKKSATPEIAFAKFTDLASSPTSAFSIAKNTKSVSGRLGLKFTDLKPDPALKDTVLPPTQKPHSKILVENPERAATNLNAPTKLRIIEDRGHGKKQSTFSWNPEYDQWMLNRNDQLSETVTYIEKDKDPDYQNFPTRTRTRVKKRSYLRSDSHHHRNPR